MSFRKSRRIQPGLLRDERKDVAMISCALRRVESVRMAKEKRRRKRRWKVRKMTRRKCRKKRRKKA